MWSITNSSSVGQRHGSPRFNSRSSHTKDSKMVFDASKLNTQHYKRSNPGKGVALSPTVRYSIYWKRGLQVAPYYGRHLYFYCSKSVVYGMEDWVLHVGSRKIQSDAIASAWKNILINILFSVIFPSPPKRSPYFAALVQYYYLYPSL